jgi:heat-inducible transcriptional repressor
LEARVLDDRKLAVLRAIVQDYVSTEEPVGSKTLTERHDLGVSPATIRNEMAVLEEEGYIAQPHPSAGRVPTDKGYRLFVDRLSAIKPLSVAERRAIGQFLDGAVDLDDVINRTVRLLAQLTSQVAVVQYPSLARATVRHIELLPVAPTRVLVVLITSSGRVEQRVIDCGIQVDEQSIAALRSQLNHTVAGLRSHDLAVALADLRDSFGADAQALVKPVIAAVLETLADQHEERIVLGGTANLARFVQDFHGSIRPVLEALEEQVVLIHLLGEASGSQPVTVRIGHENPHEGLASTSVVSSTYSIEDQAVARLGVVGPTRMDYPGTMGAVRAVARYVGRILAGQ